MTTETITAKIVYWKEKERGGREREDGEREGQKEKDRETDQVLVSDDIISHYY